MRCLRLLSLLVLLLSSASLFAERSQDDPSAVVSALQQLLAGRPMPPQNSHDVAVWTDVRRFYAERAGLPAWVTPQSSSLAALEARQLLRTAAAHGLVAGDYGEPEIARLIDALDRSALDAPDRAKKLAGLDARLTTALMRFGHDLATGRVPPQRIDRRWTSQRTPPDFVATLAYAAEHDLASWPSTVQPPHAGYAALKSALADLRMEAANADAATRASMRVPFEQRIAQVEVNMDRWRWLPDDLGRRHLFVNIPGYGLVVSEDARTVRDLRVIVGRRGRETPVFSSRMLSVVLSPYWNIPDSIVVGETAPAVLRDPKYLEKNHIQILRATTSGMEVVDPATVQWQDPSELKTLAFRQRPGSTNALGHVKFLFPNAFGVYLHDTPADELFARPGRAFSHGCVRVDEAEELAEYILKDDPEWPADRIRATMNAGVETSITLREPIPVHIVYFTAWVDETGGLSFRPDPYGLDARHAARRRF